MDDPRRVVRERAATRDLPAKGRGAVLDPDAVLDLSRILGRPGWEIEALALETGVLPARYLRNRQSVPDAEQLRLLRSRAALVGLGGLGGAVLDQLLRLGVGRLRAADGDVFEASNLNRQALATAPNLGKAKTAAARARAAEVNPSVDFETRDAFLTPETLPGFLAGCDLAVDALGGLDARPALREAAARASIPLVTGALAGWTGYVAVALPDTPAPSDVMTGGDAAEEQLGCPAPSATLIASLMAAEAARLLCGHPSPLAGKMLLVDLRALSFDLVSL